MSSTNAQPAPSYSTHQSWPVQDPTHQGVLQGILDLHAALFQLDSAGTRLTEALARALYSTAYKCVGDVLTDRLCAVFTMAASNASVSILKEMEAMLVNSQAMDNQQQGQTLCHISLLLTKLKKQYFALCHSKMADLIHSLLCLKGEDLASGEVTKLVLKLGLADGLEPPAKSNSSLPSTPWGSPKTRKARPDNSKVQPRSGFRIMSLFERKTPPGESKGPLFVEADSKGDKQELVGEGVTTTSDTTDSKNGNSQPQGQGIFTGQQNQRESTRPNNFIQFKSVIEDTSVEQGSFAYMSSRSQLATEEELESVINLLSGVGCGSVSPMQVIPEIVSPQGSMQLTVPQIYRMPSPLSDSHLDDLRAQKSQVHRRSEGCLDLSAVGRNLWPNQQQQHHRASLPSVQIFSATGQRSGFDTPSPVPSYVRDSPSPSYTTSRDPPSPGYFHGDPPSPFRTQYANTLGVGLGNVRSSVLSPLQWSAGPNCVGGGGDGRPGYEARINQSGTWPVYSGLSSLSTGTVDPASSWSAAQDCSDLSDDSSTEDQFFAVGKDLSHVIGGKDISSDDDRENGQSMQSKSSSTWPPPSVSRGLTTDYLEPPELYNVHRPIQMQWSDPLSSRSVWANTTQDLNQHKSSQSMQGFGGVH
ncbi:uncharacterized protein LOC131934274 [Physella acuta]|uniref:uncharacterized protein LOC131934274 n=1 Tax=Physella acuta TaxID=109671 RepID=UPI0027DD6553|nr:uncharacterized protein LOC131934274 [Physella acuta]